MVTRQRFTGSKLPRARAVCGCACACTSLAVTAAGPGGVDTATQSFAGGNRFRCCWERWCAAAAAPCECGMCDIPGWNANVICLNQTNDLSVFKRCPIFFCVTLGVRWDTQGEERLDQDRVSPGMLQHPEPQHLQHWEADGLHHFLMAQNRGEKSLQQRLLSNPRVLGYFKPCNGSALTFRPLRVCLPEQHSTMEYRKR